MPEYQPIKKEIEIESFVSVYYYEYGRRLMHTSGKHPFWEMVYTPNNRQLVFHEPNKVHTHTYKKPPLGNMLVVWFVCSSLSMQFFKNKTFVANKGVEALLSLFTDEAKTALASTSGNYGNRQCCGLSNAKFGSQQLLCCYFTELLIMLIRGGEEGIKKPVQSEKSRNAAQNSLNGLIVDYLKEHIYSSLSLTDVCNHFIMGKTALCKAFRECSGESVMSFYGTLKLNEAKHLLREEMLSVTEISERLGYSCIHSFSRAFKRKFGYTPMEYRNKIAL